MSKSLGNFTTLTDLLAAHDPRAYRLLVLQSHYRAPVEVTPSSLEHASADAAGARRLRPPHGRPAGGVAPDEAAMAAFRAAMDDDLSTPAVVALLSDLRRRANVHLDAGEPDAAGPLAAAVREIAGAVGLRLGPGGDEAIPADVRRPRGPPRPGPGGPGFRRPPTPSATSWWRMGWVVEDTASGTKVHQ